ncbi:MAG: EamA family transporter RarD [Treponema sp.]|jgi:chloramphenicol-sensitive protein RarD|nr:EamA family transporter RarD [Treponema sp.]
MEKSSFSRGVFFAISAYFLWGILPLYWKFLSAIYPHHILGFRIIFSMLLVSAVLLAHKNTSWLAFYRDRRKGILLTLAAMAISVNWGLYIWAVNNGRTIETSLGYYINPLISIVMGLCFFREKLKLLQIIAFGIAFAGVTVLTVLTGKLPWISLILALTFALYGLLKKTISLSALESLGVETLIASPLGLLLLFCSFETNGLAALQSPSYLLQLPLHVMLLLLFCGLVTSLPLFLFAKGAKMLPLSTLGFIQFISPTLTFLTGLFIFGESFPTRNFIAFGFIWTAAILYIISLYTSQGKRLKEEVKN